MQKSLPHPDFLRKILRHDPETGKFIWLARTEDMFRATEGRTSLHMCRNWNVRWAEQPALTARDAYGYCVGNIERTCMKAHRVGWAMHYGKWPDLFLDHINGDVSDNRIVNLREATHSQNLQNRGPSRRGTSGHKNICFDKRREMWDVNINFGGVKHYLGAFSNLEQALQVRDQHLLKLHGDFARCQ